MSYGLKYQSQFSSVTDANNSSYDYTLQFWFKDFTGSPTSIDGAGVSVVQRSDTDDPVAPIKGQYLDIRLINKGNLPISQFESEDDDGIKVILLDHNNDVRFIGYLLQDDFSEIEVTYGHEITLTASDSLGLLKGVTLDNASVRRKFYAVRQTNGVNTEIYVYVEDIAFYPQPGDTIEIGGGTYTIDTATPQIPLTVISSIGYNWLIVTTTSTGGISYGDEYIFLTGEVNLTERNSLLSMIAVCLAQTNIALVTNVFMNLYEYRQDNTRSCLPQTLISSQTFISGDTYQNCYDALTKILETFKCTLFQANGQWNIVNWFEAKQYTDNKIPGFVFDETWSEIGTTVLDNNFVIGPDPQLTRPTYPLSKRFYRGWKFTKKKLDYEYPRYLLYNSDLLVLGELRSQYESNGILYQEYIARFWENSGSSPAVTRFIRIETDIALNKEIQRYLVVTGPTDFFNVAKAVQSRPIEVRQGDVMKFSFKFRGSQTFAGAWSLTFAVQLYDGTLSNYIDELPVGNEDWKTPFGYHFDGTGLQTNEWREIEMTPKPFPFSGLLYIYFTEFQQSGVETHFKDIRFEYISYINDSTKIIGQTHKQEQTGTKKLNQSQDITIDDAPRNAISGALFLPTKTGLVQDLTTYWRYPPDATGWRLGERSTLQELTWRQRTRLIYEGGFIGNWQNAKPVSLLTMCQLTFDTSKNYAFGLLSIDYKNNRFSGTLWEIHDTEDGEFNPDYEFKYLYSTT